MSKESVITPEMKESLLSWRTDPVVFEVEKGAIKRYAEALGDANLLWTDEARARKSKCGGLVAMPVFLSYFNPFHWGTARPSGVPLFASLDSHVSFLKIGRAHV